MEEEEKKKVNPFAVVAGVVSTLTVMVVSSLLGDKGTIYGGALSSVVSSIGLVWYENWSRTAHAKLKALREQEKADLEGTHYLQDRLKELPLGENALISARTKRNLQGWDWRKRLLLGGGTLVLCMSVAVITLFSVEAATGKTLSSNLHGTAQYGTTLGGFTTHSPTPSPSVSPSYQGGSPTAPASTTAPSSPSPSPDESPSTPAASYTGVSE